MTVAVVVENNDDGTAEAVAFIRNVSIVAKPIFGSPGSGKLERTEAWKTIRCDLLPKAPDAMQRIVGMTVIGDQRDHERILRSIRENLCYWILDSSVAWLREHTNTGPEDAAPRELGAFHYGYPDFLLPFGTRHTGPLGKAEPEFAFVGGMAMRKPFDVNRRMIKAALEHANRELKNPASGFPWLKKRVESVRPLATHLLLEVRPACDISPAAAALRLVAEALPKTLSDYATGHDVVKIAGESTSTIVITNDWSQPEPPNGRTILLVEVDPKRERYGLCFFKEPKTAGGRRDRAMVIAPRDQWTRWAEYLLLGFIRDSRAGS